MVNKALFLDRDGIINVDKGYISNIKDFHFKKDIFKILRYFISKGYLIIIVTNQSGVNRGYFTKEDLKKIHLYMLKVLKKNKIKIDAIYSCCSCNDKNYYRKPNPGMFIRAKNKFKLDMDRCILLGDKESDILAGKNAEVGCNVLLKENVLPDFCISDLKNIKRLIT
jgi:D-glycero-D-manno-heptose 1,7-bisphosphate phosphatase